MPRPDPQEPRPFGTRDVTQSIFHFATALLSRYYSFFATVCIETNKKNATTMKQEQQN